jgi:DNA-directed RNA polymerase subunit RPC12/RpoP
MAVPPPLPQERPEPPLERKAPPAGRKFPCRHCGAKLDFDPEARGLKCPYCGFTEVIPEADADQKAEVREHDLDEFLDRHEEQAGAAIAGHSSQVKCGGCGAVVVLEDRVATEQCPYCGTHLENKPEEVRDLIAPESLLPFAVSDRHAREAFNGWIASLWFAPTELKQLANLGQFGSVYVPFWTYDAMTYTRYTGQRGDDYWDTEYYTDAQGNRQSRQVRRTRWYPVSGEVRHFFDDVLIRASQSLPSHLVDHLPPWELKSLEPFRDEFLSGHVTERYSVSLKDGFRQARAVMEDSITGLIHRDIGGDHQQIEWRRTNYVGVTFKHTLLPVWVANYRYRDRLFQVLVNGRTGKVAGDRPWSWWKIVRLGLLIIFAILLAVILVSKAKGQEASAPVRTESQDPSGITVVGGDYRLPPGVWAGNERPVPGGAYGIVQAAGAARGESAAARSNRHEGDRGIAVHDRNIPGGNWRFRRLVALQALDREP